MVGGRPEPQTKRVYPWKTKNTYPEPEPTTGGFTWTQTKGGYTWNPTKTYPEPEPATGGFTWNQKTTYPEPEPTTKPVNPTNPNTPSWFSTLIAYMNALRAELLTKMDQCCAKNYGKSDVWTMRKFRERLDDQKRTRMGFGYGQDYSDDDYDESGPQPYKPIQPKAYSDIF